MAKPPKKQTAQDRANQIGVSVQTLHNWRRCGVDTMDDDQVKERLAKIRQLPQGLNPEFVPKVKAPAVPLDTDPTTVDIESIIAQIGAATDKNSAQTVKTQIDALVNAYKLREAAGKYVSKATVEESLLRIGATFKGAILRMEADLPPTLEGLGPAAMQKAIREKVDEVLRSLDDEYKKVYDETDT